MDVLRVLQINAMAHAIAGSQKRWLDLIDEFIQHWTDANAALAPGSIVLPGGYTLATFSADRAALALAMDDVVGKSNTLSIARTNRDLKQAAVALRFKQFRAAVLALLPDSRYVDAIPPTPQLAEPDGAWRKLMQDLRDLWTAINLNNPPITGFTPPLTLAGGYSILLFQGDQSQVNLAMDDAGKALQPLRIARTARDDQFEALYRRMKQYRQIIGAQFAPTSPVLLSLPRLWSLRSRRKLAPPPEG